MCVFIGARRERKIKLQAESFAFSSDFIDDKEEEKPIIRGLVFAFFSNIEISIELMGY